MMSPMGGKAVMGSPLGVTAKRAPAAEANWWEAGGATGCIGAWQGIGAANIAASKVNLANPGTHDLTPYGGTPFFDTVDGWTNNGGWDTGIVPQPNYTAIIQFSNCNTDGGGVLFGTYANFYVMPRLGGNLVRYANDGNIEIAPEMTEGNLCIAGTKGYRDGALETSSLPNTVSTTETVILFGLNADNDGNVYNAVQGTIAAFAMFDNTPSAPTIAALRAAMAAL